MENYKYGQFGQRHLKDSQKGISLFNRQHYWECHEALEDEWLEARGDNARYVYWTIIQVATCLYHLEGDNLAGAAGQILKAKHKIGQCEKLNVETEILYKYLGWEQLKKLVKAIPENPELSDFIKLSHFRFKDPTIWEIEWET